MNYTIEEKLACVEREIKMRNRVYPRWIQEGRMAEEKAKFEIACMESVAADYRAIIAKERLI